MPPVRQEIFCGLTLEKSNAGEMKLATMLMPTVAVTNVRPPSRIANGVSIRCTVSIGSVISSPNTGTVAGGGDHGQQGEEQEVDRQPQEVAALDRLEAAPVTGEVAEVEHRAREVRHDDRDRGDHHRDGRREAERLAAVQVEVDVRPTRLRHQVDRQDDHHDVHRGARPVDEPADGLHAGPEQRRLGHPEDRVARSSPALRARGSSTCMSACEAREELQEDDVERLGGEVGLHAVPGHRDEPADDGGDVRALHAEDRPVDHRVRHAGLLARLRHQVHEDLHDDDADRAARPAPASPRCPARTGCPP